MPNGKPLGVRCVNLTSENRCAIHGQAHYPAVCANLKPEPAMCGTSNEHAFRYLHELDMLTRPEPADVL